MNQGVKTSLLRGALSGRDSRDARLNAGAGSGPGTLATERRGLWPSDRSWAILAPARSGAAPLSRSMNIAFADCSVDFKARQLTRGGRIVPLEPKMFQLLEVLIERRPAVVSNSELDEILWPKVYVARTSLTRLISELRALIGDSPRESRIIRTVYKTGYAFCADVMAGTTRLQAIPAASLWWSDRQLALSEGANIAGRGEECSPVIDASTVSRRHARVTILRGMATIEDLGSTNGTYVNGVRICAPTALADDDEIALGKVVLRFRARDPAAPTAFVTADA
jgi:DNA-binding winged helix-turn-helix (wHTH) protein